MPKDSQPDNKRARMKKCRGQTPITRENQNQNRTAKKQSIPNNDVRGEAMAKKGMKRPERTHTRPRNEVPPVPELQGRAKTAKEKAKPITEP